MSEWIENREGVMIPIEDLFVEVETASGTVSRGYAREFNWIRDGKRVHEIKRYRVLPTVLVDAVIQPSHYEIQKLAELQRKVDAWNNWRHDNACRLLKKVYGLSTGVLSIDQFVDLLADNADTVIEALRPYASEADDE